MNQNQRCPVKIEVIEKQAVAFEFLFGPRRNIIAISYDSSLSVARSIRRSRNVVGNRSNLVRLFADRRENPWFFVVGKEIPIPMDEEQAISVEDPTAIRHRDSILVAYTKVKNFKHSQGHRWRGELHCLEFDSLKTLQDSYLLLHPEHCESDEINFVKELEAIGHGSCWHCFFECGKSGKSVVMHAVSHDLYGLYAKSSFTPWLIPRPDSWDNSHVSTGPIIQLDNGCYLMFYNGRNGNTGSSGLKPKGEWAVGVLLFSLPWRSGATPEILYRSDKPLLWDEDRHIGYDDQIICFASSARRVNTHEWVIYAHIADRHSVAYRLRIIC